MSELSTPHLELPGFTPDATAEEWVQAAGLQVRFWRAGSGPVILLVHGLLGYSFSWRRVVPLLARANNEVFAPDMPGAGFSECRDDLDFRLSGAAQRLLAFMDAAGIDSCDLVGSSYGGSTAVLLAGLAPSKVRSLVLVSPANPWSRIGITRLSLLRNPVIASLFPKLARAAHPFHRYFVRRMWGDPGSVSKATLDGYTLPLLRPGVFEHAVKIVQTWQADMREVAATLPKIVGIPSLLVWGSKDRAVDIRSAEILKQQLPGARMAVMDGAGHLPYEENPQQFIQIVGEFLRNARSANTTSPAR